MTEERESPRISVNKLAEYLTANPAKRRKIIEDQKRPAVFRVNWYEAAQSTICDFFLDPARNEEIITQEIDRLYNETPTNEPEQWKFNSNAEALESFLESYEEVDIDGLSLRRESNQCPRLITSDVEISVRPELLAVGVYRGAETVGGIKLYFSKESRLDDNSSKYITAVLNRYLEEHRSDLGTPNRRFSLVYDVFGGAVYSAPHSRSRRFQDIEAACEEISLRWPGL